MRTTILSLAGLGLLVGHALAAPTTTNTMPPLEITKIKLHQVHNGNTTIDFTVYDPSPLTNATQECSATWKTGSGGYPSGLYQPCGNSTFAWEMDSFTSISSFTLAIEHLYEDDAYVTPTPLKASCRYEILLTFAQHRRLPL